MRAAAHAVVGRRGPRWRLCHIVRAVSGSPEAVAADISAATDAAVSLTPDASMRLYRACASVARPAVASARSTVLNDTVSGLSAPGCLRTRPHQFKVSGIAEGANVPCRFRVNTPVDSQRQNSPLKVHAF